MSLAPDHHFLTVSSHPQAAASHAASSTAPVASTPVTSTPADSLTQALQAMLPDLSVGAILGFATGIAMKFLGRMVLVVVGLLFIAVQLLAWSGIVTVDWLKLQAITEPWVKEGRETGLPWLLHALTANLPFAGAFTAGLLLGLRSRL